MMGYFMPVVENAGACRAYGQLRKRYRPTSVGRVRINKRYPPEYARLARWASVHNGPFAPIPERTRKRQEARARR